MNDRILGQLIRRERLLKNWSQDGLCKGICAVSYLSKIEQGKTSASEEITAKLIKRLGASWYPEFAAQAKSCCDQCYDAIFSGDNKTYQTAIQELNNQWEFYLNGPCMMDALVIHSWDVHAVDPLLTELEPEGRQKTLLLLLQNNYDKALRSDPSPLTYLNAGINRYESGNFPAAIELLQQSYNLAARDGLIHMMLNSRLFLGNCYSNLHDYETMLGHYRVCERIAISLNNEQAMTDIRYNTAATQLELGRIEEALVGFSQLKYSSALSWHKMAVCYEKLGNRKEAQHCLTEAEQRSDEFFLPEIIKQMCAVIHFRLDHPDYLTNAQYGTQLLSLFSRLRAELPHGYAVFHLPWVLEWYQANRQYRNAYELLSTFPSI